MARKFPSNTFVAPKYGKGNRLVVAEAPGSTESEKGEPLVGESGQFFDKLAKCAGLKRDDLTLVNILNCRPPDNIFPTSPEARSYISAAEGAQAVAHCRKAHVDPLLKGKRWDRIDLLGNIALRELTGKDGISEYRGSPLPVIGLGDSPKAIATFHPSYLLTKAQELLQVSINDLEKDLSVPPERYNLFPTLEQVQNFRAEQFAFDIETNYFKVGEDPFIHMVGLCASPYEAMVVPYQGAYIKELRRIFRDAKSIIGHNCIQFDLPVLQYGNIKPSDSCLVWDTMLLQHLRFPDIPHDLEFVASQFSNKPAWKGEKSKAFQLYCARDTDVTLQIFTKLLPLVREEKLLDLYQKVQVPLAKICYQMFQTGFKVDPSQVGKVRELLLSEMASLELKLPEQLRSYDKEVRKRLPAPAGTRSTKTGKPVKFLLEPALERVTPWRSSQKKQEYLYGKEETWQLGLEPQLDLKSGNITTGKLALDKLFRKSKNPALPALKKLNQLDELVTTFCKEEMSGGAFRQHPHFNVHGTSSGRLSSSDPNLQNIPETARIIYVPSSPGWKIIDVDFSGIESRITAFLAQDKWRLDQLARDPDFSEHKHLCARMTGIPYDEVEKDNTPGSPYFNAKKVVHGVNYGLGALKLSKMYDLDLKETKEFMAGWKAIIKDTVFWQNITAEKAKRDGFLVTPFGRKRWFYCLVPETKTLLPDLTWAPLGSLQEGQEIVAFDEEPQSGKGCGRKLRRATVLACDRKTLPCYEIVTDRGTVTASSGHPFLVNRKSSGTAQYVWRTSESLKEGQEVAFLCEPWEEDSSREAGYLAGVLDGEGSVNRYGVTFAQNQGAVLARTKDGLLTRGYKYSQRPDSRKCVHVQITGDMCNSLKLLGTLRPSRLLQNSAKLWEGHRVWGKKTESAKIISVKFVGDREVVALETSTKTIIAEGLLTHNTSSYFTESLSFIPQSTAADVIYRAMIGLLYQRIGLPVTEAQAIVPIVEPLPEPSRLLIQVHDSLVVEAPENMVDKVCLAIRKVLTQPWPELKGFSIPIGIKVGSSWGLAEKYSFL